jgi:hypothetical protein
MAKLDFNKGVCIEIGGELGKNNSLSVDFFAKFLTDLQNLIFSLAKYDLPSNEPIDLNNFKIELSGFHAGSAIPEVRFVTKVQDSPLMTLDTQRYSINDSFSGLMDIVENENYTSLLQLFPEPQKRTPIISCLYEFTKNVSGNAFSFVDYNKVDNTITPIVKLHKMGIGVKNSLVSEIYETTGLPEEDQTAFGKIIISNKSGTPRKKIKELYTEKEISLDFAPAQIPVGERTYILKQPLRCLFEKEEDFFIIQSEMLDIIGTGLTPEEAQQCFYQEFDYIFQTYNSLSDDQLTQRLVSIKIILNQIVKTVS